jgi:hypothetical protein
MQRSWVSSNWRWPCRPCEKVTVRISTIGENTPVCDAKHAPCVRHCVSASCHTHTHTRTTSPCTVVRLAKHTLATRSCQKTDATELIEWVSERSRVEVWLRRWSRACRAWCRVSCACPNTNGRGALPSHTHTSLIHLSWPHPTTPCELAPSDHTLRCAALCKLMSSAPLSHL